MVARLLFASRKPLHPAGQGGGEISVHTLLTELQSLGVTAMAVGSFRAGDLPMLAARLGACRVDARFAEERHDLAGPAGQRWRMTSDARISYRPAVDGYEVELCLADTFSDLLAARLEQWRPDRVLLQAEGWDDSLAVVKQAGASSVLYLRNGLELHGCHPPGQRPPPRSLPDYLLANSHFVARRVQQEFGLDLPVVYPAMDLAACRAPAADDGRRYITFINPVVVKGVETFLEIAMRRPSCEFLCVEGWSAPSIILDFMRKVPNIRYLPHQEDMAEIYARSRLLLVPSIWEEAFGRVVVEAQAASVPVIASNRGGIGEALGEGGILIDDHRNVVEWLRAIDRLQTDHQLYQRCQRLGLQNTRRFDLRQTAIEFLRQVELQQE